MCSADSLYVEEIDVGEATPRQIVSGLVKYVPIEQFEKARVCVICNLKPSALRGENSAGMVLAASNADRSQVELITPPDSATPGTKITLINQDCSGWQADESVDPKAKKDNAWEAVRVGLKTDSTGVATWEGNPLGTKGEACKSATLTDAVIS